ncbi:MAG TPA: alpha/beta fold hydrolase [Gemmatimonadaceae bacterium]
MKLILFAALVGSLQGQAPLLSPCHLPGVPSEARCGTFSVRENRSDRASRSIPLEVIVLPSRSAKPKADPLLLVSPGGPGTTNSESIVRRGWHSWMRDDRDIVIVDLRGTSGPSRLDCDFADPRAPDSVFLGPLFPPEGVAQCKSALEKKADLRYYTTPIIVDDLEEVRRALGYDRVNLWAVSWGTRVVYLWLKRHPEHIRSVILEGSAPVSFLNPLPHARNAQVAIDSLFAECARQRNCHAGFPNVGRELDSVIARLKRSPETVRVAGRNAMTSVPLTWETFAEGLRLMTYNPPRMQRVPLLVHRAFLGEFKDFVADAVASNRGTRGSIRFGFLLAITCTEDVSRIDPHTIARATVGTYLGDSRVRAQMAACAQWPRGALAPDYGDPVRSTVPAFLLSGTVDPVAGSELTAEAAKYLPNSIHVIAPGGHVPFGSCVDAMERAFLTAANPRAVDTSCVRAMRLPDFVTR